MFRGTFEAQPFHVSISSPSSEGGESYVFKPRHSKAFRPPNRRTPLAKKINIAIFAKMTPLKSLPSMASTQVNERISILAILGGASMGYHANMKNYL